MFSFCLLVRPTVGAMNVCMSVCLFKCHCKWCASVRVQVDIPPLVLGLGFASLELSSYVLLVHVLGAFSMCQCVWMGPGFESQHWVRIPARVQARVASSTVIPVIPVIPVFPVFLWCTRPLNPRVCVPHLHWHFLSIYHVDATSQSNGSPNPMGAWTGTSEPSCLCVCVLQMLQGPCSCAPIPSIPSHTAAVWTGVVSFLCLCVCLYV